MGHQFETERFHVETGPDSLFERVRSVMDEPRELRIDPDHVKQRSAERDAPIEELKQFDPDQWELKTAEVRTDKGMFVNTAWACKADGRDWWVIIGFEDTVMTVIETDKNGLGPKIVTEGDLYNRVKQVNKNKNQEES